jgi:hypothetical protein
MFMIKSFTFIMLFVLELILTIQVYDDVKAAAGTISGLMIRLEVSSLFHDYHVNFFLILQLKNLTKSFAF